MISDTSCSLRAADMESPLPRWPTLLQSKGTQSGPASQQSGMHGQCHSTDLSPQLPQRQRVGRREGPGLPYLQGQPRTKGSGGGTEPPTHRPTEECQNPETAGGSAAASLLRCPKKAQPHRSTFKSQLCLCGPVPRFPPL